MLNCEFVFRLTGGLLLIMLLGPFEYLRWTCRVTQLVQRTPLWPASWLPVVDKSRGSKSVEVQRVWEVYDERLQKMSRQDAVRLDEFLNAGDVSCAWLVWYRAAETALADAYRFSGGPLPSGSLVLGRGMLRSGLSGFGVTRFGRLVVMLLMRMMLLMFSFTVTLLLLPCLT